jgi:hypothetical protein
MLISKIPDYQFVYSLKRSRSIIQILVIMKSVVIVDWKCNWIPNIKTSVIKCCCNQRHFRASRIYRFQLGNMFPLERIPK